MTWKIIKSGENRISAFVFPYQDKGPRFTFDQAADARGDILAETADDFAERSHRCCH